MAIERIGFVGAGLMGSGMVRNLLRAGYAVTVHDIDAARIEALVAEGATRATSPERIAPAVDVIMLSLPNSAIVREVVADRLKLLEPARKRLIVIDTSTGEPDDTRALALTLRASGIELLDAAVSGTSEMCAARDVIFMVGGNATAFETCRGLFGALGKEALHLGDSGSGAVAKLIVNLVLGLNRMALAEGLTLAGKADLDRAQVLSVLEKSAAYSKAMDQKGRRMVERRYDPPASRLGASYKGARLMLALAARHDCPVPLLALYTQALASGVAKKRGGWDTAAIVEFYEDLLASAPE
jgi:3-hydroxyisobutyrate dehydrogenase-like beta-hydroxyacid dehydrogenase